MSAALAHHQLVGIVGGLAGAPACAAEGQGAKAARFAAPEPPAFINDWSRDEFQFKFAPPSSGAVVYLYVPADAKKLRALLLLQENVAEQLISVHPAIRGACDANAVAIAWCQPGFDPHFDLATAGKAHETVQRAFGHFGQSIGYPELGQVPLVTFGHSATCAYCQNAAEACPERVLAVLATHGWNGVDSFRNYKGPVLLFMGSYWEQHQQSRAVGSNKGIMSLGKVRKKLDENWMPISVVDEYGSGHFDYSDRVVEVMAMFIDKAVKARLDPDGKLRDIDPASGYIATIPALPARPIAVKPYTAGTAREQAGSVWFFDKELAEAAVKVIDGSGTWARACQLIGYDNPDGTPAPFGKSGLVNPVPYEIVPGTNEIRIFPVLLDAFPAGFEEAGKPLDMCGDPTITLEYVCGPYIYLDKDGKYRVKHNRGGPAGYLVARNLGDDKLRPAVQPTRLVLGRRNAGEAPVFSPGPQKAGAVVPLKNASSSGEYVGYYIDHGPARIVNQTLAILPLPANTQGPVEVELVAYRLGQAVNGMSSVKFNVTK